MVDVSYPAFFDELSKIAEAQPEDDKKYVTKEKLKRLAKVVGAAGAGAALGLGAGRLVRHAVGKRRPEIVEWFKKRPKWQKALPIAGGALAAGGAMVAATKKRKVQQYLEKKKDDQGSGPK